MKKFFFSFLLGLPLLFSNNFYYGVAISEFQNSGPRVVDNCNWTAFANESAEDFKGRKNHFEDYESYIAALKELGVNSFRFSLEWSLIEKEEGVFDEKVMERYRKEIKALKAAGIEPFVTMHHFTEPLWFTEKGGFNKKENLEAFEDFAVYVFNAFKEDVTYWSVINEPVVCAYMESKLNEWAAKKGLEQTKTSSMLVPNLLTTHVNVYEKCKEIDPTAQIGFVHSFIAFKAYNSWEPVQNSVAYYMSRFWNEIVYQFFLDGEADFTYLKYFGFKHKDDRAPHSFDYVGVNYYSRPTVGWIINDYYLPQPYVTCAQGEVMTDMPYHMDPEGFYETLMRCKDFGKPIYVTENGIADAKDDRRETSIKKHDAALERAKEDGADVRGFFYWTLFDNFEWAERFDMKFGLFDVDQESGSVKIKDGALAYKEIIGANLIPTFVAAKPVEEKKEEVVKKEKKELVLYVKKGCPFCDKVLKYLEAKGEKVTIKDASIEENRAYLVAHGKKSQVPCLFIDEKPMYESNDIITYFSKNLSK